MSSYPEDRLREKITSILGDQQLSSWIVQEAEFRCLPSEAEQFAEDVANRYLSGEPIQYIFGHWSFRSIELKCDPRALIPRPETEYLVEIAKSHLARNPGWHDIFEIGTGTGAIALSLAIECPGLSIFATDVSDEALCLAEENLGQTKNLISEVRLGCSNLFDSLVDEQFDLIVSNPPYVPTSSEVDPRVANYEPHIALFGGEDGFDLLRRIITQAVTRFNGRGRLLLLEIDESHPKKVRITAERAGYSECEIIQDLAGRDRFARLIW